MHKDRAGRGLNPYGDHAGELVSVLPCSDGRTGGVREICRRSELSGDAKQPESVPKQRGT